jgi:predicted hydrocarbon binding protein
MSLLLERPGPPGPLPNLSGREKLVDANKPELCVVKGVMFAGRQKFLTSQFGEAEFQKVLALLSPKTLRYATTPLAGTWCEFASIVEFDRAIHETFKEKWPNILALVGAASAEHGIGTVYRVLDDKELLKFLEGIAAFHEQFQKYGKVVFTKTAEGAQMSYTGYLCYSPVYCASAVGFFLEAVLRHGGRDPKVVETKCHSRGDTECLYDLQWH